jgi:hypothetical protein
MITMMGGFGAAPGQPLQRPPFPLLLGVRLHAPPGTNPTGHSLEATIHDQIGGPFSNTQTVPVAFVTMKPGLPLLGLAQLPLDSWDPLPGVGRYTVSLSVDGTPVGQHHMMVNSTQRSGSKPSAASIGGLRLNWAHYVMGVMNDPRLPGSPTIGGIFEYVPGTGRAGYNLKGTLLLLDILSDLTIKTQRTLTTELLDSTGQPAHDPNERLLMPTHTRPITLRRLSPAWDFLDSTATVRFDRDLWLAPGGYAFRFAVDGQPLGEPLPLVVVSAR